jgi:transcriptional regulator with XRE-family HTH domain
MWRWIRWWIMEGAKGSIIEKALELRRQGYSYREIAEKLGYSKSYIASLLSPYENPRSRAKQMIELADQVENLNKTVNELNKRLNELKSSLSEIKPLEELSRSNAELRREIQLLAQKIKEHDEAIKNIIALLTKITEEIAGG